jgi:hypothetical protein
MYWTLGALPGTRDSTRRLGLVTLQQMIATLTIAVEHPATGFSHSRNTADSFQQA